VQQFPFLPLCFDQPAIALLDRIGHRVVTACQLGELVVAAALDTRGFVTAACGVHAGDDPPQWAHEQSSSG